jgi:hypothetical protein
MNSLARVMIGLVLAAAPLTAAMAQQPAFLPNPDLQNRIPKPLPPPAQPPVINGPLAQNAPTGVVVPPRLKTFSDRANGCLDLGVSAGLRGKDLDAYTRSCSNAR